MAFLKKSRPKPSSAFKEKAARSIAGRLVGIQTRVAKWLHRWQQNSSVRKRNVTLALLALAWLAYCLYLLITAIFDLHG